MATNLDRLEFIGGPMDGAIRHVHRDCHRMPLAVGAVVHVYARDEVYMGFAVREVMRHIKTFSSCDHEPPKGRNST
jgi:hypothetical protein